MTTRTCYPSWLPLLIPMPQRRSRTPERLREEPRLSQTAHYATMESLAALEAVAPGLIENQCAGDKHVTMYKDDKRKEVWLLSKNDDHIVPKATICGGFGSGHVNPRKADRTD